MTRSMVAALLVGLGAAVGGLIVLWYGDSRALASHGAGGSFLGLQAERIYETAGYAVLSFGGALAAAALWDWFRHGSRTDATEPPRPAAG